MEDARGDIASMVSSGDEPSRTLPRCHKHATETFVAPPCVIRVWLDDQRGTRIVEDVCDFALLAGSRTQVPLLGNR